LLATSLRCVSCGEVYSIDERISTCARCEGILEVEYDYEEMRNQFKKDSLDKNAMPGLWRYAEALPVCRESIVTLGEGFTPLLKTSRVGGANLMVKLDFIAPTGSFKDRGSTIVVSKANELKVSSIAIDSTGNAAASVSAYAAKAGIRCYVFIPSHTEAEKVVQISSTGATVVKVRGTRADVHNVIEDAYRKFGWYYCGFMVSPYAVEGTKTIAYEICEQLDWSVPDWIVFPVGTGSGIVGCYKGLRELLELGWIDQMPRLVCIQPDACAPIAEAFKKGKADIIPVLAPRTVAEGLAVGAPPKGGLVLEALRKTSGVAEVVSDNRILEAARALASEGLYSEVSSAASVAGALKLIDAALIGKNDSIVCELTGTGLKSHREYAEMTQSPIEIDPSLDSLLQALKIRSVQL
jgi:threonine synthase